VLKHKNVSVREKKKVLQIPDKCRFCRVGHGILIIFYHIFLHGFIFIQLLTQLVEITDL